MGYSSSPTSFVVEEHRMARSMGSRCTDTDWKHRRAPRCSSVVKLEYGLEDLATVAGEEGACAASWMRGSTAWWCHPSCAHQGSKPISTVVAVVAEKAAYLVSITWLVQISHSRLLALGEFDWF